MQDSEAAYGSRGYVKLTMVILRGWVNVISVEEEEQKKRATISPVFLKLRTNLKDLEFVHNTDGDKASISSSSRGLMTHVVNFFQFQTEANIAV